MTKDERQSALNEVKVLSMLSHPNIIEYYENFLEDKALMIVMEYAQGNLKCRGLEPLKHRYLVYSHAHTSQVLLLDPILPTVHCYNPLVDKI